MALPLLVRFRQAPTVETVASDHAYDPQTETAVAANDNSQVLATQSLLTNANSDPTSDEPTDR